MTELYTVVDPNKPSPHDVAPVGARALNATALSSYDEATTKGYLNLAQASYCVDSTTSWSCPTCDAGVTVTAVVEDSGLLVRCCARDAVDVRAFGTTDFVN